MLLNTAAERRLYKGHFAGGEPAGKGVDSYYELAPPVPTDPMVGPHYRLVRQVAGQWGPHFERLSGSLSRVWLANTVRHDTLSRTELRLVKGIQTGSTCWRGGRSARRPGTPPPGLARRAAAR